MFTLPKVEGRKSKFPTLDELVEYHVGKKASLPCKLVLSTRRSTAATISRVATVSGAKVSGGDASGAKTAGAKARYRFSYPVLLGAVCFMQARLSYES